MKTEHKKMQTVTLPMGGPRIAVKVTFEDGNSLVSTINATPAEARRYYAIGRVFNIGNGEHDDEQRVGSVELLETKIGGAK